VAAAAEGILLEDLKLPTSAGAKSGLSDSFSKRTYVAAPMSHGSFLFEDKTSLYAPQTELHKHVYVYAQKRSPVSGLRKRHTTSQDSECEIQECEKQDETETTVAAANIAQAQSKGQNLRTKLLVPAVLSLLVVQNACQMLSMRYTKVASTAESKVYLSSTAVVVSEFLKVGACLVILAVQNKGKFVSVVYNDVFVNWKDTLLVSVPAFVYMMQNNLLYVAASNLDAATCQITYQLKILTTALFAVSMLGKQMTQMKWASLLVLVAGVALVQTPNTAATSTAGNPLVGLSAVISACFMSGFAGIYFEKVLKGSTTSIWTRNVQMGSMGALLAIITAYAKDGAAIGSHGFFQGWTPLVAAVAVQVGLGGLLTALVVRHADNILKGFATSVSIIVSGIISIYMIPALKFSPSPMWMSGSALVMLATLLYSLPDAPSPPQPPSLQQQQQQQQQLPPQQRHVAAA